MPLGMQADLQEACQALKQSQTVVTFQAHLTKWWSIVNTELAKADPAAANAAIQWLAFQARRFDQCFGPWSQVGLTEHAMTEPSNARLLGALQTKNSGLLFTVRDVLYLILHQEEHLKSLMKFGSVRQGMMTKHQDNKQCQVYRRHVAQELLMELTLVHKGDALQKMTAADLFLPNVANARMPGIGEGDSHSHKASISSAQQEEMADAMRESQDTTNSMNLNPRWPAAMPLPTWNADTDANRNAKHLERVSPC